MIKKTLKWLGLIVVLAVVALVGYALMQGRAFDASMAKVYDVPLPNITRSNDPQVIARGKHLAESLAFCAAGDCHKADLGGGGAGSEKALGPLGHFGCPNAAKHAAEYSDGELARLIRDGIKRDGHGVLFMPCDDFSWLPDEDVQAIVSYVRSVPVVERSDATTEFKLFAKVLDRRGAFKVDVARLIDHANRPTVPTPAPTAQYGAFVARSCKGCHGDGLAGGPIPGAPPDLPVPLNLTPDATGLQGWAYDDFARVLDQGLRKNGQKLNPFMPVEALSKLNDTERHAVWAFLQQLPPTAFGKR
jgi:hypothetical protein